MNADLNEERGVQVLLHVLDALLQLSHGFQSLLPV